MGNMGQVCAAGNVWVPGVKTRYVHIQPGSCDQKSNRLRAKGTEGCKARWDTDTESLKLG